MRASSHSGRVSLFGIAVLASLCLSAPGSAASRVDGLTINVLYTASSLQVKLSNGTVVGSGTVVPPGPYSVVVYDSGDYPGPQFTMTGPGASVSSDLNPSGMGIEVPMTFGPFVLQPSSSYEISDTNMGGASAVQFTTSATGSSASSSPSPDGSSSNGSPSPAAPTSSGSATAKTLGALTLSVGPNAKPSLALGGKPVKTLKPGKYLLIAGDSSKKAGLLIGHGTAHPSTLSGVAAVGTSSRTLKLTAGRWFFEASTRGPKIYFTVT